MSQAHDLLRRVRVRIAAANAVEDLQVGLALGAGTCLATLAAQRFVVLALDPRWPVWAGAAVAVAVPLGRLLTGRGDARTFAARADERLGLRERLSTALWCESAAEAGPLAELVVSDADHAASCVRPADLSRAFRPRLLRRPLTVAGALALGTLGLVVWQPVAEAVESPAAKAARLAEADRIAQVARKLEEAAKRAEEVAAAHKETDLAKLAREVREATQAMQRDPPPKEQALSRLNKLGEQAKSEARRRAGLRAPADTPEANEQDRALAKLLQALTDAKLESLQKDLSEMEKRLNAGKDGAGANDAGEKPSAEELRSLAERVDALRRAMEAAAQSGASEVERKLRSIGNEDLLQKISERLRELAANLEQRGYEGLESDESGEDMDLGEMTREELEELLRQLDEMSRMEDLAEMLRQGGAEARGGKRLRVPRPGGAGGT